MSNYGSIDRNRRRKRKKRFNSLLFVVILLSILVLAGIGGLLYLLVIKPNQSGTVPTVVTTATGAPVGSTAAQIETTIAPISGDYQEILKVAETKAAMYDYDGAIAYIKEQVAGYESIGALNDFISSCQAKKTQLIKWSDNTKITHIFFHILVQDEQTAFALSNYQRDEYNQVMTTVQEFKDIIQEMYNRGYVMVHLSDIASVQKDADGNEKMVYNAIYLPEGKIPFVLSQDDLCYYEYMVDAGSGVKSSERGETLTGYATKLVFDADGNITNEMAMAGGSYSYGSFDLVTIIDDFVEEHPDFSYHGAKGTLALTGYNGIFGYRTSQIAYEPGNTTWPSVHLYDNTNIVADREMCVKIANRLKETGWKFASHTWGHMRMTKFDSTNPAEQFYRDTSWWQTEVASLVGDTDIMIFAFGADIGTWRNYTSENKMYTYLKSQGFSYFCNVDASTHYWVQMASSVKSEDGTYVDSGYLRQGRRNIDGERMLEDILYPEKDRLSDLFVSKKIFSRLRPLPAKGTTSYIGVTLPDTYDPNTLFD